MGRPKLELAGRRFGRWLVIQFHSSDRKYVRWWCRCDCGTERAVRTSKLQEGVSQSCGCLGREKQQAAVVTHRMTATKPYWIWRSMRQRCLVPTHKAYRNYGGRGIKICSAWDDFAAFWKDMGPTWVPGFSLERINNDGDYAPNNCTWVPLSEQPHNRRPRERWSHK